ncbi:MAG: dihydrolipoamide acetyltransferase family protein [Isosphaeraceae bacterium]
MPLEIRMPRLMDSMTHGNLAAWRKAEGEAVRPGEVLAEIEVDKTTVDLESPGEGTLGKILVPAGTEKVEVGTLLAVLEEAAQPRSEGGNQPAAEAAPPGGDRANGHPSRPAQDAAEPAAPVVAPHARPDLVGVLASPLALSMARQAGLDLAPLTPAGPGGRIVQADVLKALGAGDQRVSSFNPTARVAEPVASYEAVPHSRVRQAIARRLSESKRTIPHFYLEVQCCVDPLLRVRGQASVGGDPRLSINDFVVRAAAAAARAVPEVNASWTEEATRRYTRVDLAVAVSTDAGLVAPVIRDADRKGAGRAGLGLRDLAAPGRADGSGRRNSRRDPHRQQSRHVRRRRHLRDHPTRPRPPSLGLGARRPRPVARELGRRRHDPICTLSADHRVLDSSDAARFLSAFKGFPRTADHDGPLMTVARSRVRGSLARVVRSRRSMRT